MLKKTVLTFAFLTILTTFYGFNAQFSAPATDDALNALAEMHHSLLPEGSYVISAYDNLIRNISEEEGHDWRLMSAIAYHESRFTPDITSSRGACGLMQIMPDKAVVDWAKRFRVPVPNKGALYAPRLNIEIGTWYLGNALKRWASYKDNLALALCEYNAGIKRANAWKPVDRNGDVRERITISSTLSYVNSILAQYEDYKKSWQKKHPQKGTIR